MDPNSLTIPRQGAKLIGERSTHFRDRAFLLPSTSKPNILYRVKRPVVYLGLARRELTAPTCFTRW